MIGVLNGLGDSSTSHLATSWASTSKYFTPLMKYFDVLAQDVAEWDLLSPNPFQHAEIMRRAFGTTADPGVQLPQARHPAQRRDHPNRRRGPAAAGAAGKADGVRATSGRDRSTPPAGTFDFRLDLERASQMGNKLVFLIRGITWPRTCRPAAVSRST